MKNCIKRVGSFLMSLVIISSLSIPAFAKEVPTSEGFTPENDSTWGDLYRFFAPEEFFELPTEIQNLYDSMPLEQGSSSGAVPMQAESTDGYSSVVIATAELYPEEPSESAKENRAIDINGLLFMPLGTTGNKNSIDYTMALGSTITCPVLALALSCYDTETNQYVGWDSGHTTNSKLYALDGTFDDLVSKRTYKLTGTGTVTPPAGYIQSNPMAVTDTVTCK